jgi:hypothetical protein
MAAGCAIGGVPMNPDPDDIMLRVIEAAFVSGEPGKAHGGPLLLRASWPDPSRINASRQDKALQKLSWAERNARYQGEVAGTRERADDYRLDPQAIARAEQVYCDWVPPALRDMPDEAVCLWAFAFAECKKLSFRKFCERNGIGRWKATTLKDKALQRISEYVGSHYAWFSPADASLANQITTEHHTSDLCSPTFVRSGDRLYTPMSPEDIARIEASILEHNNRVRKAKARRQRRKRRG